MYFSIVQSICIGKNLMQIKRKKAGCLIILTVYFLSKYNIKDCL